MILIDSTGRKIPADYERDKNAILSAIRRAIFDIGTASVPINEKLADGVTAVMVNSTNVLLHMPKYGEKNKGLKTLAAMPRFALVKIHRAVVAERDKKPGRISQPETSYICEDCWNYLEVGDNGRFCYYCNKEVKP